MFLCHCRVKIEIPEKRISLNYLLKKILNVCIPISGLILSIFFIEKSVFSKNSLENFPKKNKTSLLHLL